MDKRRLATAGVEMGSLTFYAKAKLNNKLVPHEMENKNKVPNRQGIYARYLKRPVDFCCALVAAIVFSPIIGAIALLVRLKLGSPVLFKQKRSGLDEEPFEILKFRSMTDEKDAEGNLLPDEVRLTSFGKKLRSTSLDELPSLFNILNGDMSVIGPRALPIKYVPYYTEEEHHRHDVRPGLSGLAQVSGRNYVSWEDKFKMDLAYISNISFLGDLKLILKTIAVVFERENIDTGSYIEKDGRIYRPLNVERENKVEN